MKLNVIARLTPTVIARQLVAEAIQEACDIMVVGNTGLVFVRNDDVHNAGRQADIGVSAGGRPQDQISRLAV